MKRALIYSALFHLLLFTIAILLQNYLKKDQPFSEPLSVLILPVKPETTLPPNKEKITPPKKLEKIPPIKQQNQPKYLSSIPKGNKGYEHKENSEEKSLSETLREERQFSEIKPQRNADIFDKDVIAKFSGKRSENIKAESSQGITFSAREFNDWGYLQRLKEKIERVWQYPPQAAKRGIFGDLYLKFTIDKKGKLISVELIRTSGYRMLDDAAIQALKDAQPFWPLPEDWQRDNLTITGHFIYTLYGFYVR